MAVLPYRTCCGQQHLDPTVCPDGKVMCCLCFDRFDVTGLNSLGLDGREMERPEDVCRPCAERDRVELVVHRLVALSGGQSNG